MTQEFDDHDTPTEADLDLCYGSKFLSAIELGDKKIRTTHPKVKKEPLRGKTARRKTSSSCRLATSTRASWPMPPISRPLSTHSAKLLPTGSMPMSESSPSRP